MSRINNVGVSLLSLSLAACSTAVTEHAVSPTVSAPPSIQMSGVEQASAAAENLGKQVERHLRTRYDDNAVNCGADSKPAFLCSGIMLRATPRGANYPVWNNSEASQKKGGVSFSYLREDTDFDRLVYGYDNGFIFQSYFHAKDKLSPEVLCSFPTDAATNGRPTDSGCGPYPLPDTELCHLRGIVTAEQWWADFSSHTPIRHYWQCGFDVRDSRNQLAGPAFAASVKARSLMGQVGFTVQNEIILKAWPDDLGKTLPLEAFFYLYGTDGLVDAQNNQHRLKATDGVVIPIIRIKLASAMDKAATFDFLPVDQVETMPPPRP